MPKIIECEQNSDEWYQARAGVATTSSFDKILTQGGKLSAQADAYSHKILADLALGLQEGSFKGNAATEWGHLHEDRAAENYEFSTDRETKKIGFILSDCGFFGSSPDRIVDEDGLLEIKCPNPDTHIGYMLEGMLDKKYKVQRLGQLFVAERDWGDIISYQPELPLVKTSYERDIEFLEIMQEALEGFKDIMLQKIERLSNDWKINLQTTYGI